MEFESADEDFEQRIPRCLVLQWSQVRWISRTCTLAEATPLPWPFAATAIPLSSAWHMRNIRNIRNVAGYACYACYASVRE